MSDQIGDHSGSPNDVVLEQDHRGGAQYEPSGSQIRPWVRYWARMTDLFIFSMFMWIFGLIYPPLLKLSEGISALLPLFLYNFAEPAMFSIWGTTPGKALFKVRVRNGDGSKLSYSDALRRAFKVWINGEGLGLPLVSIFTLVKSHNKLTNSGITSWDEDKGIIVSHRILGTWRVIGIVALFAAFLGLMVLGTLDSK